MLLNKAKYKIGEGSLCTHRILRKTVCALDYDAEATGIALGRA